MARGRGVVKAVAVKAVAVKAAAVKAGAGSKKLEESLPHQSA